MMSTHIVGLATTEAQEQAQIEAWSRWSTVESRGRRALTAGRRRRYRHPREWHWHRIAYYGWPVVAALAAIGVLWGPTP